MNTSPHRRHAPRPGRIPAVACTLLLALSLAACDRSATEPTVDGLVVNEIIVAGDDGSYSFSHRDHWHGAPLVRQGATAGFTLYFTDLELGADDHDIPPTESWFTLEEHPDHALRVVVEDTTVARWSGDRVRGTLHGLREGSSRISFVVLRGSTTIYEAPPLNFRVQPPLE